MLNPLDISGEPLIHQVDSGGTKRRAKKRECSGTQMDKIKTATRCSSFYSHTN